jgi:hypothetical protein
MFDYYVLTKYKTIDSLNDNIVVTFFFYRIVYVNFNIFTLNLHRVFLGVKETATSAIR